jgi:hypothetical protein
MIQQIREGLQEGDQKGGMDDFSYTSLSPFEDFAGASQVVCDAPIPLYRKSKGMFM